MPPQGRVTRGALAQAEDFASLSSRDRLIFAQAVYEHGARQSSWAEISKILSKHPLISKPKNFATVQSCAAIYNYLMSEAELERTDLCEAKKAPIHAQLAQRFYRGRLAELRNQIGAEEDRFKTLTSEIEEIRAGRWDDRIRAKLGGVEIVHDVPASDPTEAPEPEPPVATSEDTPMQTEEPMEDQQDDAVVAEVPVSDGEMAMDVSSPMHPSSPPPQESSPRQGTPKAAEEQSAESASTESELSPVPPTSEEQPPVSPKHAPKTRSQSRREPAEAVKSPTPTPEEDEEMAEAEEEEEAQEPVAEEEGMEDVEPAQESSPDQPSPDRTVSREDEAMEAVSREWSLAPQERQDGKRRASDAESSREKKRARDRSEPVDAGESPAPATPSAMQSAAGTKDAKERKRFQSVILMLHAQITAHRNGTIFHNPIKPSDAPDYQDIVKRPMDLKTVKNRVKDGRVSSSSEYQRDIYLMFANSLMYNRPNSDIYMMAEEMMLDSEAEIQNFQQTEAYNLRTRG